MIPFSGRKSSHGDSLSVSVFRVGVGNARARVSETSRYTPVLAVRGSVVFHSRARVSETSCWRQRDVTGTLQVRGRASARRLAGATGLGCISQGGVADSSRGVRPCPKMCDAAAQQDVSLALQVATCRGRAPTPPRPQNPWASVAVSDFQPPNLPYSIALYIFSSVKFRGRICDVRRPTPRAGPAPSPYR